jgi:colicin import membrane protein
MVSSRPLETGGLLKMGGVSLLVHIAFVAFFSLNLWPTIIKARPTAYTVTLMPIPIQEPKIQKPSLPPVVKEEIPKPIEKPKIEKPKKDDIVEKIKKTQKEKVELKDLQEAIEEIRKKVALDKIEKNVARREKTEERAPVVSPPVPMVSSPKTSPISQSKESKLEDLYGDLVKLKINEVWTIPENLLKEMVDLETIIVIIIDKDGRVQKSWFEKKSGNALYDQSAMRAIKKAEPLPPIPKELKQNSFEFGIRFTPDSIR